MRPLWLRVPAGLTVLVAGAGALVIAWWALFVWISLTPLLAALVVATVSPVAAWPLFAGRFGHSGWGALQMTALVVVLGFYVIVALVAAAQAIQAVTTRDVHATPALVCAGWIALAAGAALLIATLIAALPLDERDTVLAVVAGALALAGLGGAGAAVAIAAGPSSCERFEPNRAAWTHDRERVAEGLVRCRTLVGRSERDVQQLLGGKRARERWHVGYADEFIGFGHQQSLLVTWSGGRVRSARLLYSPR